MKEYYIVHGAHIKCSFGSHVQRINLPVEHGASVNGQPVLCKTDNAYDANIPCFGVCRSPNNPSMETVTYIAQGASHRIASGKPCVPIPGEWNDTKADTLLWDEESLTTKSYLICNWKGEVTFVDSGQKSESKSMIERRFPVGGNVLVVEEKKKQKGIPQRRSKGQTVDKVAEKTEWIPDEPLRIDDDNMLTKKLRKLGITQEKIDEIWEVSRLYYSAHGVAFDPRFALSIIGHEGTGSFNTSSKNPGADGQHGFEKDWAVDLMKANKFLFGKMLGYMAYGDRFNSAVATNTDLPGIGDGGNFSKYCNWSTPRVDVETGKIIIGIYAGHGEWNIDVTSFYESVAGSGRMQDYSDYIAAFGEDKVREIIPSSDLQDIDFTASQNAQDSKGIPNGEYTIIAK